MALLFYPHEDDLDKGSMEEKLDLLRDAAERYKAVILDLASKTAQAEAAQGKSENEHKKRMVPRELVAAFNWDAVAKVLREIREMPETTGPGKAMKAQRLTKLAEIYELLRAAKMPKLEAVRLALINEANQIHGGSSQVA